MCIVVLSIGCGTTTKGIKTPVEDMGLYAGATTADDRYLLQCAGRPLPRQTVSLRLHEGGLFARRSAACLPLSPAHVRARLHWAREHCSYTPEQWGHVLSTDESRFNIQNDFRRAMIWRREPGTRYRAPNIVERDHYRGGGLPVWPGIATNGRTHLYVFAGGFRHSCPISRRNPTHSCAAFYRRNGYRRDIYGR
ncbi:hypothetical protein AVEN_30411-1 [Araneus ventricosus]|uniref:Transposase Tc1-like domain-containing protein n=1 Tax=Araneus ventricosus TaxID=182803 RepID=A0A4Y2S9G5_ARAVE|nr:hypothetical protein AVEN_30411-1 [Araneus ventricosus]